MAIVTVGSTGLMPWCAFGYCRGHGCACEEGLHKGRVPVEVGATIQRTGALRPGELGEDLQIEVEAFGYKGVSRRILKAQRWLFAMPELVL